MSKAFNCDRCGMLYKEKGGSIMRQGALKIEIYDLCPECEKELAQWLDNEVYFVGHKEAADGPAQTEE